MAVTDTVSAPAAGASIRRNGRDVFFALGIVVILAVLFLPIPAFLIDVGLAFSIALSVLILMVSLWIQRPLDFSSFPTVRCIATMLLRCSISDCPMRPSDCSEKRRVSLMTLRVSSIRCLSQPLPAISCSVP